MAPPRVPAAAKSAKRGARPRAAAPNPNPAPFAEPGESNLPRWMLHELRYGSLRQINRLVEEAQRGEGVGALHYAARHGIIPVCRYLVEDLRVDVDAYDDNGANPLVYAIIGESVETINYLLDPGADPGKANDEGFTALHHAAGTGNCKLVELLLAKGVSIDPVSACGTPLHIAAIDGHGEVMELLLENNADHKRIIPGIETPLLAAIDASSVKCVRLLVEAGVDVNDGLVTPLASAVDKGLTECLKCLLEAGADPLTFLILLVALQSVLPDPGASNPYRMLERKAIKNKNRYSILNHSGKMPIEIAALKGTREDVEILFPVTSCIPTVHDWSIDGIITHAKSVCMEQGEYSKVRKIAELRSLAANSIKRNDYITAADLYSMAMKLDPHDATLLSNRSFCWYRMGDGHEALLDALACREMQPNWPMGCYRQGAALMLLKDYESACDAFLHAAKLDPLSQEIGAALREAMNSLKTSRGRRLSK